MLIHISEVELAIAELCRVVRPGGSLIVSEGNMRSLQSLAFRFLKKIIWKKSSKITHTPSGVEHWQETQAGLFLTRHANIPWLISEFGKHGFSVRKHLPGQMTDAYTKLPFQFLKRSIHAFNHFWFEKVRNPGLAIGNLLSFKWVDRNGLAN